MKQCFKPGGEHEKTPHNKLADEPTCRPNPTDPTSTSLQGTWYCFDDQQQQNLTTPAEKVSRVDSQAVIENVRASQKNLRPRQWNL